jgi:hypothetical protein
MELAKKFMVASSSAYMKINTLEVDKKYPIVHEERVNTKFGETILLCIQDSSFNVFKVFLLKDILLSSLMMI